MGFSCFKTLKEPSIIGVQGCVYRLHKAIERLNMIIVSERLEGHPLELSLECVALVLSARADKLSDRTPVAYKGGNEAVANLVNEPFLVEQASHIEEIARMLPVKRGTDLAAEKLAA